MSRSSEDASTADSAEVTAPKEPKEARSETPREKEQRHLAAQITAAAMGSPPALADVLQHTAPALKAGMEVIAFIAPFYVQLAKLVMMAYHTLPLDILQALTGLGLCFFGGTYCASIAAVEAFRLVGWSTTRAALNDIYGEALTIRDATTADAKKDDDGDGVADASVLPAAELVQRKLRVAVLAVRDPCAPSGLKPSECCPPAAPGAACTSTLQPPPPPPPPRSFACCMHCAEPHARVRVPTAVAGVRSYARSHPCAHAWRPLLHREKLSVAVGGLYAGWLAVQGTLRHQFAKTITLGISIAQMLDAPAMRLGLPILAHLCVAHPPHTPQQRALFQLHSLHPPPEPP